MHLRTWHRSTAFVIAVFAAVHLANHLVALSGVAAHVAFMETARTIYRLPPVEAVLLCCVGFQVASGLWLFVRGWRTRRGRVAWLQAISGAYLAFFLLVHVSAVLVGRHVLHLDTNFHFAAAGFHVTPYQLFFGPYYFLAVVSLSAHLGCALYWRARTRRALALAVPVAMGFVLAALITLTLGGVLTPVEVPAEYKAPYGL